jgi:hypothetical protein
MTREVRFDPAALRFFSHRLRRGTTEVLANGTWSYRRKRPGTRPRGRDRRVLKSRLVETDPTSVTDQPPSQRSASAREVKTGPPSVNDSSDGPLAGFTRIAMGESGRADASAALSARTSVNKSGDSLSVLSTSSGTPER